MNLFTYAQFKQREFIESQIQRDLETDPIHGRLPGFKVAGNVHGQITVLPSEEETVAGVIWRGLSNEDLTKLDAYMTPTWSRELHKVLVLPWFPLVHEMYVIDAWVYVQPVVSIYGEFKK